MKELMVLVERAVRPVRAEGRRKMRMRQELLAHLTAAHEQEQARLGDAPAAFTRAAQRFGDPAELTRNLQASVPLLERVLFTPLPGTKWLTRLQGRMVAKPRPVLGVVLWSLLGLALAGPAVGLYLAWPDAPSDFRAAETIALSLGATALTPLAVAATYRALAGKLGPAAWLRAAAVALPAALLPCAVITLALPAMLEMPVGYGALAASAAVLYTGVLGLALISRFQAEARRRTEEWTTLDIGN